MLRPERMSRVSVTGAQTVMDDVIGTIHDMRLLHMTDYDGAWEGFEPGDPIEGADDAAEKLVTVRSLQSILGVDEEDAGPGRLVTDEALETELEEIRETINELDDRRNELNDELRRVDERIDAMEPFATLGIDLDLLSGYDSISVVVGEGSVSGVEATLADAGISTYELFDESGVIAVAAQVDDLEEQLVGSSFTALDVPEADSDPSEYVEQLQHERQQLESKRRTVEGEMENHRLEHGDFLLAVEEKLAIDVQRTEAPLSFATTENAFVAEGWIPTSRFGEFVETLHDSVGDRIEIDELERASYNSDGHIVDREGMDGSGSHGGAEPTATATDGGEPARTDGGTEATMSYSEPPSIQSNPNPVKSFESLVNSYGRPSYTELDPSLIMFLTFPFMFGFMIGDLGYGLLYAGIGYFIAKKFDGIVADLGRVALWAGIFTGVFGVLYGEIFGLHQLGELVWGGDPPMHKGLIPAHDSYASLWIVLSLVFGIVHQSIGYLFSFYEHLQHGVGDAIRESGSWFMMLFGFWAWVFANTPPYGLTPDFIVTSESGVFSGHPLELGFTGLPETVGFIGIGLFLVGLVLVATTELAEFIEAVFLKVVADILSYTRLAAVLIAKAGMAFAANLLVFGAYTTDHGHGDVYHFIFFSDKTPAKIAADHHAEMIFPGLVNGSGAELLVGAIAGIAILIFAHLLVLALGLTSAGLQSIRLEWVEFFQKFYDGGGEKYEPFGYVRKFTNKE
ncbi:V-type ATP synthase subunit I [Halocatena halophila]|uniref:V-type ATP synthase subunit I n=1 Tax=Halocatena halophila TaxID=2814576 RepID=UPI002ED2499D